jgi:hypothetical protein
MVALRCRSLLAQNGRLIYPWTALAIGRGDGGIPGFHNAGFNVNTR